MAKRLERMMAASEEMKKSLNKTSEEPEIIKPTSKRKSTFYDFNTPPNAK